MVEFDESRRCLTQIFRGVGKVSDFKDVNLTDEEQGMQSKISYCQTAYRGKGGKYCIDFNEGRFMLSRLQLIAAIIQVEKYRVFRKGDTFELHDRYLNFPDPEDPDSLVCQIQTNGQEVTDPDLKPDKDGFTLINGRILTHLMLSADKIKLNLDYDAFKISNDIFYKSIKFNEHYNQAIDQITDDQTFVKYLDDCAKRNYAELQSKED